MKNAVVTIAIGPEFERIAELTHPTMRAYAAKIGADFVVLDKKELAVTSPHFEKFRLYHLLNKYNRIIYLDTDMVVRPDCPNLFDTVPYNKLGLFNEGPFVNRLEQMQEACRVYSIEIQKWKNEFYNTGVMVVSRPHKFLFDKPHNEEIHALHDQALLNLRFLRTQSAGERPEIFHLSYAFNRMSFMDMLTGEPRHASYIIHYAMAPNKEVVYNLIADDLLRWKANTPEFNFRRNIHVKAHGGMGDQMCAEPVVRYMIEKAYRGANFTIETWYPRLFRHLPAKLFRMNAFQPEPDTPYHIVEPLQSPENIIWQFASANLMHNTDFASLSCLRQILPDENKQFKLDVNLEEVVEALDLVGTTPMNELVLVHPGRGWPSKTFPAGWWKAVTDGLWRAGHKVAIIGKNINEDQGLVDFELPPGTCDLRNAHTLGGLIALISQAKMLITNDSVPLHLAGAFDNNIVVVPTCKHPDHILPMRSGSRYHKARALYGDLLCRQIDSTPTQIHGQTIDKVPGGDITRFLPEPQAVVNAVGEMS